MSKSGSEATLNSEINVPFVVTRPSEQKAPQPPKSPENETDKEGVQIRNLKTKVYFTDLRFLPAKRQQGNCTSANGYHH